MSIEWKCAGCGCPEPFPCNCSTGVAFAEGGHSAWKCEVIRRRSFISTMRWKLFSVLVKLAWRIHPDPQGKFWDVMQR